MKLKLRALIPASEVYWKYLVAEKHKLLSPQGPEIRFLEDFLRKTEQPLSFWRRLLEEPDLQNPKENRARRHLLFSLYKRGTILAALPQETQWAQAEIADSSDLSNLFSIHDSDRNPTGLLSTLAPRFRNEPSYLYRPPEEWAALIVWCHDPETGPFTILEGNHRMIGFFNAFHEEPSLTLVGFSSIYVGFCDQPCSYHPPDVEADPEGLRAMILEQIKILELRRSYLDYQCRQASLSLSRKGSSG